MKPHICEVSFPHAYAQKPCFSLVCLSLYYNSYLVIALTREN